MVLSNVIWSSGLGLNTIIIYISDEKFSQRLMDFQCTYIKKVWLKDLEYFALKRDLEGWNGGT